MSKKMGRKGRTTKHKQTIEEIEATSAPLQLGDFPNMKRPQLQKLCKQLGLKATGKVRKHNIIVLRIKWSARNLQSLLCLNEFVTTILVKMFSTLIVFPAKELQFMSIPPPLLDCWLLAVKNLLHIIRVVTKISSCWVIATSRQGKKSARDFLGFYFCYGPLS